MHLLTGRIQYYAWGTTDAIPRLLGVPETGEPHAEYWLGAHTSAPATLPGGTGLDAALAEHPDWLGEDSRRAFGDRLPYLLKVLSADRALSLQAHPTREQAQQGYAAERAAGVDPGAPTRNYADDWPKPEALIARTPFSALCGFRTVDDARDALNTLNAPRPLVAELDGPDPLRAAFFAALGLADFQVRKVVDTAWAYAEAGGRPGALARTVLELDRAFGLDPGIVASLLLNRIELEPDQAIFLGAGNLHAYLSGTGIEIMANSDNVLRGGLTRKHIDTAELGRIVDFTPGAPTIITGVEEAPGLLRYPTPAPEFAIWRLASPAGLELPAAGAARIVLVADGELTLTGASELIIDAGAAAFLPAGEAVTATGTGTAYLAAPGG